MISLVAAVALLSGCGASDPPPAPVQKQIKVQGEAQKQLASASAMDRAIGFKRALYDSGLACKRLTQSLFVTDYKNLAMWRATCADGKEWAIFVAPDGSTQVRPCADLKELKLPECDVTGARPDRTTAGPKPAA